MSEISSKQIYAAVARQMAANVTEAAARDGGTALERMRGLRDAVGPDPINDHALALVATGQASRADVAAELNRLERFDTLTRAQQQRRDALLAELAELERVQRDADIAKIRSVMESGAGSVERGTPVNPHDGYDKDSHTAPRSTEYMRRVPDPWAERSEPVTGSPAERARAMRDLALAAVEKTPDAKDSGRDRIVRALDEQHGEPMTKIARWARATSDPAYARAWSKIAVDPVGGHRGFTDVELRAFQAVQMEARAMSLTDSAGGYLVPFQLDPTVLLTNDGDTGVMRQICRTVIATGDTWSGISSAGITAEEYAEAAEVGDHSPTLAQPSIQVHRSSAFVPISIEAIEDEANVAQEVAKMLADALFRLDEEKFTTGTGSGEPWGVVTALTGTGSEVNQTGSTLDAADWIAVQNALPPRFQANASWITHLVSMNVARATPIATGLDSPMLKEGAPPTILGKPVYENDYMDSSVTGSASDYLTVYGDFSNMVIADRVGMTIEFIPHLVGSNRRPTGQRGWFAYRRRGADVVVDNAFRMLDKSA